MSGSIAKISIFTVAHFNKYKTLFASTLQQLGYGTLEESAGKVTPSGEWLFDQKEETRPFLMWLCDNMKPSNVLLGDEIKRYLMSWSPKN